ncbi:hypothetical protein, partial [Streptomyces scabiei]|uniref:hypothetical protein n=1 Tax=Streptomyces scabiei TaxID=1930 RepID=UPI001F254FA6
MVDADQDQHVVSDDGPVGCLQAQVGDVRLGAGHDGGHGAGMGGVAVEADVGVDGGSHVGVSSLLPVAGPSGPATGVFGGYRVARAARTVRTAVVVGGPARMVGAG